MIASTDPFARLIHQFDPQSTLARAWPLMGGISAQVTALEVIDAYGNTRKIIVRQHGAVDLARNPNIAEDEFTLLRQLHTNGLAVPAPLHLDRSGAIFATPVVVIEFIEGTTGFPSPPPTDHIQQFATQLASVHALDPAQMDLSFLPQQADTVARRLNTAPATADRSPDEGRIWDVLQAVWPIVQHNPPVLLHGDFWPGNTLWCENQLVAVIDWEDAALGDPLADLANSRLEILWAAGREAMDQFTQAYQSIRRIDLTNLPYWELCAALRPVTGLASWGLDDHTERSMRDALRAFIADAFGSLPH